MEETCRKLGILTHLPQRAATPFQWRLLLRRLAAPQHRVRLIPPFPNARMLRFKHVCKLPGAVQMHARARSSSGYFEARQAHLEKGRRVISDPP